MMGRAGCSTGAGWRSRRKGQEEKTGGAARPPPKVRGSSFQLPDRIVGVRFDGKGKGDLGASSWPRFRKRYTGSKLKYETFLWAGRGDQAVSDEQLLICGRPPLS